MIAKTSFKIFGFWRYSAFRQAFLFAAIFLAGMLTVGIVIFLSVGAELTASVDQRLDQRWQSIAQNMQDEDFDDLDEIISVNQTSSSGRTDDIGRVTAIFDQQRTLVSGDPIRFVEATGSSTSPGSAFGIDDDEPFRLLNRPVGTYHLLVGETLEPLEETEEILLMAFLWGAIFVLVLTLFTGIILGRHMQRRVARINSGLTAFANGQFDARISDPAPDDDIGRIAQSADEMLERLQASIRAMSDMSANIAHDLKTPISRLQTLIQEAQVSSLSGEQASAMLARIETEAGSIAGTFDAVLRISQINAGARRERFRKTDMLEIVTAVFDIYASVAEDSGISLSCHGSAGDARAGDTPCVLGDRDLLFQMLVNLVENAIQHTPTGTAITLAARSTASHVLIEVTDTGPGVNTADLERLAEPHYRTDKSRSTTGSGLGLALVDSVARLHDGGLTLTNADPGLRALVSLPKHSSSF